MSIDIIIILSAVMVMGGMYLLYYFHRKRYKLILGTKTSRITTLKKGFFEIKGEVKFFEEKLISPYSKIPCVYYKFKVEEYRGNGKSSNWQEVIDDERDVRFYVEDSSGKAIINIEGAKLKLDTDLRGRSGIFSSSSDELEKVLEHYHRSSKVWIFEKSLRFTETYIPEGDNLYVLGEVQDFTGYYPEFSKGKLPYLISDKPEEELLERAKRISRLAIFFLIALPVAVALYLFFHSSVL